MQVIQNLFICDPVEQWNLLSDTTVLMMKEVESRGQGLYYCTPKDLALAGTEISAHVKDISFQDTPPYYHIHSSREKPLTFFDLVHIRMNPPVDIGYIHTLMLLDSFDANNPSQRPVIINRPSSVLRFNEKMINFHFPDFMCPTIVSSDVRQLCGFIRTHREVVVKPLDDCSGRGVRRLSSKDGFEQVLDELSRHGELTLMVQEYLDDVETSGDVRVLIVNGEVLSVMKRIPAEENFLCNLDQGATCHKLDLPEDEIAKIAGLGPFLVEQGLYFVAVDMIGGKLCEINVTSPGLIHEMNRINSQQLQTRMQDLFEGLLQGNR